MTERQRAEGATAVAARGERRAIWSWCLFDFANSPFTTLVITFVYSAWFVQAVNSPEDPTRGERLWSLAATVSALVGAFCSPVLGALADRGGLRKLGMAVFALLLAAGSLGLSLLELPEHVLLALCCFVTADLGFELGSVFYNAFLPDIAPPERIGRISGYGWALGYAGGLAALVIALVGFVLPEHPWLGVSKEGGAHVRATCALVGVWFVLFALPLFLFVREDRAQAEAGRSGIVGAAWRQLASSLREVRRYRQVMRLIVARIFYNDGLVTIFAFAAIYASGTFHMSQAETLYLGIVVNVAAGLGAWAMGHMDDRLGGKRTLIYSVHGLMLGTLCALLGPSKAWLWAGGILVGIFSGPNQSASRSLMGRFVPPDKENEFFGFLAFSGRATAFLGPLLFGQLTALTGSQRVGLMPVLLFLVIGWLLLRTVDEEEGVRVAGRAG